MIIDSLIFARLNIKNNYMVGHNRLYIHITQIEINSRVINLL